MIGRGSTATVYRAWDRRRGAVVALKVASYEPGRDGPEMAAHWEREAGLLERLGHAAHCSLLRPLLRRARAEPGPRAGVRRGRIARIAPGPRWCADLGDGRWHCARRRPWADVCPSVAYPPRREAGQHPPRPGPARGAHRLRRCQGPGQWSDGQHHRRHRSLHGPGAAPRCPGGWPDRCLSPWGWCSRRCYAASTPGRRSRRRSRRPRQPSPCPTWRRPRPLRIGCERRWTAPRSPTRWARYPSMAAFVSELDAIAALAARQQPAVIPAAPRRRWSVRPPQWAVALGGAAALAALAWILVTFVGPGKPPPPAPAPAATTTIARLAAPTVPPIPVPTATLAPTVTPAPTATPVPPPTSVPTAAAIPTIEPTAYLGQGDAYNCDDFATQAQAPGSAPRRSLRSQPARRE